MALKENGDKVKVCVILTKDQKERLDAQAERYGIGISAMARMAIAEWLENREK